MPRCRYNSQDTRAKVIEVLKLIQQNNIQNTIYLLPNDREAFPDPKAPLLLGPVGRECHPEYLSYTDMSTAINALLKVLDDLHKIEWCHCDVRWPNVILDVKSNKFVLIDFEYARKVGQDCPAIKNKFKHSKILETKKWYPFGDTYQVILMIQRWVCVYKNISSTQRAQANQLVESLKQQVQDDVKKSLQPSHVDSVVVTTAAVTATSTNTSKDAVI